jgi:hypothetical protein
MICILALHDHEFCLEFGCKRQQRDIPRPLDGDAEPALMARAGTRHPAGQHFAAILQEWLQQLDFFVVNEINFLDAEPAHFFLAKKLPLASASAARTAAGPSAIFAAFAGRALRTRCGC